MTIKFGSDKEVKISGWSLTKILFTVAAVSASVARISKYKYKYGCAGKKDA